MSGQAQNGARRNSPGPEIRRLPTNCIAAPAAPLARPASPP